MPDKNKKKIIERKIYFYKIVCTMDGNDIKPDIIFNKYIELFNENYENLEDRNLAMPYFEKYHFLEVKQHSFDKDVFFGKFFSLRSTDFPYLFNMSNGDRKEISSNSLFIR